MVSIVTLVQIYNHLKTKIMKKKDKSKEMNIKISSVIHRKDCLPPPLRLRSDYQIKSPPVSEANETLKNRDFEKQPPTSVNVHQKEIDKIATNMAVLFEKKITACELAKWLTIANSHSDPNDDLIWSLGYNILPGLIEGKNQDDRIRFLKKELPETFSVYRMANKSLFQLGEDYFKKNKGLGYFIEQIEEFINVFLTLLAICEMFENYEYEEREMDKKTDKAA